ncbi:glycogen/starch/alpha-glucan family phosphorylase [Clostridium sartagoforme]|uniref:Alpha-1,4 glucan phosphorylase n=1 Tax=Clostridium sartagoforme TaxID=84031 RepID=A0A4S2DFS1_9CLOT|nr:MULTISPECIES: glycogen/starch/alpha-glucan phosphorylase [Clostridium]MBS5939533.1 glycogen/starch/alpha-glucan family phosphorylase [Clostridium sp.]TGY40332.1 glycogen/starch/alpha-glucan family phosphorylase [Clostridium sartagoforme]
MQINSLMKKIKEGLLRDYDKEVDRASVQEVHNVVAKIAITEISKAWHESENRFNTNRHAYFLSAEFLMGRAVQNNLICMGIYDEVKEALNQLGFDINKFEEIEDMALGNGGLGRLAACFLDSAASVNVPLKGYGIRYKYGLFKQKIEEGFQKEYADNWTSFGDEWSLRRFEDSIKIRFKDIEVLAVPYDMPIIGYENDNIGTLRLWQSEAIEDFDFDLFNNCKYDEAIRNKTIAENISAGLYPNDNTYEGKILRFRQQYFFSSASLQDLIRKYKELHGKDFSKLVSLNTIQLNDTHPVIAIPEFIRLMTLENNVEFDDAFNMAKEIFNYTNHTVMAEALEKWDVNLVKDLVPEVYEVIEKINEKLIEELTDLKVKKEDLDKYEVIKDNQVHMARLATYIGKYINGVAEIHSEILKKDTLKEWYEIYPDKFQNKTNGITQRRWLASCNKELTELYSRLLGDKSFLKDLSKLKELEKYSENKDIIDEFIQIKKNKKRELIDYIYKHEGIKLEEHFILDVQIKRLHEYKRQFMNALSILDIYFRLKDGELKDFTPTAFIFGGKAAPGYARAKAIIKFINEIADLINNDKDVQDKLKVVFVQNYNVSYAEKLIPGANVSEQISTAGTEASGTGNMKFMLNGAVTLGTYDGANIEIVREAGEENNYIFGATEEEVLRIKDSYDPVEIYNKDKHIKRVIDTLVDGTFSDGYEEEEVTEVKDGVEEATDENIEKEEIETVEEKLIEGTFKELYYALLKGTHWHKADHYFILNDLERYFNARIKLSNDYKNEYEFARKCFINSVNAGFFSSDRTIKEYAEEIWKL